MYSNMEDLALGPGQFNSITYMKLKKKYIFKRALDLNATRLRVSTVL